MPVLAPPARTIAPALGNQLLVLRERLGEPRRVQPARAAQVAGIAQVIACGKVPGNLVAMNGGAAVGVLEGIALARHFHPANAHADLRTECARARDVGFGMALGLVQFAVQRIGHVLAAWLTVGRHAPVCAYRGLIALQRKHGGANAVILGRRNALLLLGLEQF